MRPCGFGTCWIHALAKLQARFGVDSALHDRISLGDVRPTPCCAASAGVDPSMVQRHMAPFNSCTS